MDAWKTISFPFGDSGNFSGANCCQFSGFFPLFFGAKESWKKLKNSKLSWSKVSGQSCQCTSKCQRYRHASARARKRRTESPVALVELLWRRNFCRYLAYIVWIWPGNVRKKNGCFEICGKRSCSDRTWVVSVLSISQYDLRYLPYVAYNVTWIPKQHIPSKQEQQEQTLRFLQKVDWPFPWIPIGIPLITFWKHINFLPQNTSPPKKKQHPSEVE